VISAVAIVALTVIDAAAEKEGRTFKSPLDNFTVPVPALGMFTSDVKVQKRNTKDQGSVSFIGDTGRLRRIDYRRIPADVIVLTVDAQQAAFLRMLQALVAANAQSVVVAQKPYEIEGVPVLLAVVTIPGASMLMDAATKKRLDSTRGVLYFVRNRFSYELHAELADGTIVNSRKLPSADELTKHAEQVLSEFYQTIAFK
jgi:hypothetical protein